MNQRKKGYDFSKTQPQTLNYTACNDCQCCKIFKIFKILPSKKFKDYGLSQNYLFCFKKDVFIYATMLNNFIKAVSLYCRDL